MARKIITGRAIRPTAPAVMTRRRLLGIIEAAADLNDVKTVLRGLAAAGSDPRQATIATGNPAARGGER